jgi:ribitol 2-dehydrogenase
MMPATRRAGVNHPLSGKVVIVTGASSGIGLAASRSLARCGARLALAARAADRLAALAADLGADALAAPTDVTSGADVERLVSRTIARFGRVDALFANAGIYIPGQAAEGDPDAWARLIDVNVNGVLRCVRAVLPHMLARGSGDILVTSSISGHIDIPWEPVYSASKHAIQAFVHTLRRQVAPKGLRVMSIAPGMVANELWGFTDPAAIDAKVAARASLRSEDVAELVVTMLSQPPHVTIRDLVVLPQNQDL